MIKDLAVLFTDTNLATTGAACFDWRTVHHPVTNVQIVDVLFDELVAGIAEGRGLTPDEVEAIVDDDTILTAKLARDRGLVDRLARWHDVEQTLGRGSVVEPLPRLPKPRTDERWGAPPAVAVVYAVGPCAMESGIRGRADST